MPETAISPERSRNMSAVKGKDTQPERKVRRVLHALGYRFRLHCMDLPGRPDIVLPRYRTVVFVHGCFWHQHEGCSRASKPKTRIDFWKKKFEANVQRDRCSEQALQVLGWRVVTIWECEIYSSAQLEALLVAKMASQAADAEKSA
ncbi:XorII very short patch repair endonuclease [Mesorhizobium sp. LSJC255A00]|uniref:very short patch repair endonuclease n=1 Tax=Mesorhizobium sp. LSJC255A00 TaxID=1287313 RepID=UPI0003CF19BA|nr:very short patch repair endonuclease [Mesorhizobium sp. LSJC255A00]ESX16672.1 XorII very short patch repair endonuclease [Mesorhizobium sp. LSJC255A00]